MSLRRWKHLLPYLVAAAMLSSLPFAQVVADEHACDMADAEELVNTNPYFVVSLTENWVEALNWDLETYVTLTIDPDPQQPGPTYALTHRVEWYDETDPSLGTYASFELRDIVGENGLPYSIKTGDKVTISGAYEGGWFPRDGLVPRLAITRIDGNRVFGEAELGDGFEQWVLVRVRPAPLADRKAMQIDSHGHWCVDFSGMYEIKDKDRGRVIVMDDQGNRTRRNWHAPLLYEPEITIRLAEDGIRSAPWPPGAKVTATVLRDGSPLPPEWIEIAEDDISAYDSGWESLQSEIWFPDYVPQTGDVVELSCCAPLIQKNIVVPNQPPTITLITAPLDPVQVGTAVTFSASFDDPGDPRSHTALWSWGDEASSAGTVTDYNATGNHIYSAPGVYTVFLTLADMDEAFDTESFQFVVVYDSEGGFATGGGWINSPAGAYTANPDLAGNATFGFVSKYLKGANVPSGNTEFQFKVAELNFKSTSYDWLVVAGAKAQFKGSGTINGSGDYWFMLTAIDGQELGGGGVDKFRIKIWDKVTGETLYDNQLGVSNDTLPTTALQGGSIVVHK